MAGRHTPLRQLYLAGFTWLIADGESRSAEFLFAKKACKISVPRKMSLITYEHTFVSGGIQPGITNVEQNFSQLAEKAVENLDTQWAGHQPEHDVLMPYQFIRRHSVDLPPK